MKKSLFILLLVAGFANAQENFANWIEFIEGNHNNTNVNNLITDGESLYLNGTYFGDDTSFGGETLPNQGGVDVLISKMDKNGNVIWTSTIGGDDIDAIFDIKLDSENNIIATGWSSSHGEIVINGDYVIPSNGPEWANRGLIVKFSGEDGSLIWENSWYSAEYNVANAVRTAVDVEGDIYVSGYYSGSFQIDSVVFTYNFEYGNNIFLLKLNTDGEIIWSKQFEGNENGSWVNLNYMDVGLNGLYFIFDYYKPYNLNNVPLPYSGENYWVGIANVDLENGEVIRHTSYGTPSYQNGTALRVDKNGDIITAGYFTDGNNFDIQGTYLQGYGSEDGYVAKFTPELELIWAKAMGGDYLDRIFNLFVNDSNEIFIGGGFDNYTDFSYDGQAIIDSQSPNSLSMFQLHINSEGEFQQALALHGYDQFSTLSNTGTVVFTDGTVYTGGRLNGKAYFENGGELIDTFEHNLGFVMNWDTQFDTLGITDITATNFIVYPNPFRNNLNIISNKANSIKINVYNLMGKSVYSNSDFKGKSIDFKHLAKGVYILKMESDGFAKTMKIIKK